MCDEKLKKRIIKMLTENTGQHMLDSGGIYGRNYERNQNVDWDKTPETTVESYGDSVEITVSVYHYLLGHLEITDESEVHDKMFKAFCDSNDDYYLTNMEDYAEKFTKTNTVNTYNGECLLSQTLQFVTFKDGNDEEFIILQIHGGCDVRGGYTVPRVFAVKDIDYFYMGMVDVDCRCSKCGCSWYSDDAGYNWYPNDEEENLIIDEKDGKPIHKRCGGKLEFSGRCSF